MGSIRSVSQILSYEVRFILIILAEYGIIIFFSFIIIIIFINLNFLLSFIFINFFCSLVIFIRGLLPRIRYDELIYLCWKIILPLILIYIFLIIGIKFIILYLFILL